MKVTKRILGILTGLIAALLFLAMLGGLLSGDYTSAFLLFIIIILLFMLTGYFFDRHLPMIEEAKADALKIKNKNKTGFAKVNEKAENLEKYPSAQREDLATLWDMATAILSDDEVNHSEARLLFAFMQSKTLLAKDNRTKYLFSALKDSLDDNHLDEIEAEELKTLLSEFVDFQDQILQIENDAKKKQIVKQYNRNRVKAKKPKPTPRKQQSNYKSTASPASHYAFSYADAQGDFSDREVRFNSAKRQNGHTYLNGVCLERRALRTFRADRIHDLVDLETGEVIDNTNEYVKGLC